MSERKRAATWTSFAAARAWRPSLFLISRVRSINTTLLRARAARPGGLPCCGSPVAGSLIPPTPSCRQEVGGHADGFRALLADDVSQGGHILRLLLHRRELHDHREVHSGQDLHATLFQKREADVARCSAEHVGKDDDAVVGSDPVEGLANLLACLVDSVGLLQRASLDHSDLRFNLPCGRQQFVSESAMLE